MFQLKVPGRKDVFDVQAESQKEKDMWMETLKYVASVASRRGMIMRKSLGQSEDDSGVEKDNRQFFVEEDELPPSPRRLRDQKKVEPSMRLEIDVHSIPPGSNERAQVRVLGWGGRGEKGGYEDMNGMNIHFLTPNNNNNNSSWQPSKRTLQGRSSGATCREATSSRSPT